MVSRVLEILDLVFLVTKWVIIRRHLVLIRALVLFVNQQQPFAMIETLTLCSHLPKVIRIETHVL